MEGMLNAGSLLVRKSAGQEDVDYRPQEKESIAGECRRCDPESMNTYCQRPTSSLQEFSWQPGGRDGQWHR